MERYSISAVALALIAVVGAGAMRAEGQCLRRPLRPCRSPLYDTDMDICLARAAEEQGCQPHGWWSQWPKMTARVNGVFLDRENIPSLAFAEDATTHAEVLNTRSANLGWGSGMGADVVSHWPNGIDFDISFFAMQDWNALATASGGNLIFPLISPTEIFDTVSVSYDSDLYSLEANMRWPVHPILSLLVGFRWVELTEQMTFFAGSNLYIGTLTLKTANNIYGVQAGADVVLWQPLQCFRVDGTFKAGVYKNQPLNRLHATGDFGPFFAKVGSGSQTSFLGEILFNATFQWSEHVAVRGGYRAMWLTGVAFARRDSTGSLAVNMRGNPFFHGAHISLEYRW